MFTLEQSLYSVLRGTSEELDRIGIMIITKLCPLVTFRGGTSFHSTVFDDSTLLAPIVHVTSIERPVIQSPFVRLAAEIDIL